MFHGLNQRMPARRFPRSVCTFHDLFVITGEYSDQEFRRRFTAQACEAAARADLIVAVSSFTASQVETLLGVERSRIRVIHHGVRQLPLPEVEREAMVLSVGAIQQRKNTKRIVEAFEHLPGNWKLVLAGSPGGFGAGDVLDRIGRSSARDRIQVTGYIDDRQLGQLYARASIFLFPSLDEGFGMPVLEAMRAGIAVVASSRSALPEVCGDAALFVDPNDSEDIGGALLRLATDNETAARLREAGRKRIQYFSWEKAARQTWAVYGELSGTVQV